MDLEDVCDARQMLHGGWHTRGRWEIEDVNLISLCILCRARSSSRLTSSTFHAIFVVVPAVKVSICDHCNSSRMPDFSPIARVDVAVGFSLWSPLLVLAYPLGRL